jgi:hypothetical protein
MELQGFLIGKGRPIAAAGGLGGHFYSIYRAGLPGAGDPSGTATESSREWHLRSFEQLNGVPPRANRCRSALLREPLIP